MVFEGLVFVTSNLGKLREAEAVLGISLDHRALEIHEVQSLDLEEVVRRKAAVAFARVQRPVIVEDTSLELSGLGGFPGPLVRWLLSSVGPAGICRIAHAFEDAAATVRCIAMATDGANEASGLGVVSGRIVRAPRGSRGFGWDSTFAPDGHGGRTYGELDDAEKNAISHRMLAFRNLRDALEARR
jgi:non-canonical purine NTP pyrophosphatase (RdgB/HAM1 family)